MRKWLKELASDIAHDVGHEFMHKMEHGAHEASAALFNGSAFVMYPRGASHDDPNKHEQPEIEQEREM